MNSNITNAFEWIAKLLSAMVVPTLLWVNSLEVERAVQAKVIEDIQEKIAGNTTSISGIRGLVNDNSATLGKIQTTLEGMSKTLEEVRKALREHEVMHGNNQVRRTRRH